MNYQYEPAYDPEFCRDTEPERKQQHRDMLVLRAEELTSETSPNDPVEIDEVVRVVCVYAAISNQPKPIRDLARTVLMLLNHIAMEGMKLGAATQEPKE